MVFDPERRQWTWGNEALTQAAATDTVQFFMASRIRALAHDVDRRLLSTAAIIGRTFSLWTLGQVLGMDARQALLALRPALDAGFIAAEGRNWRYSELSGTDAIFFFVHDKVHEAARSLLTGEALLHAHRTIGETLLAEVPADTVPQQLFSAVEHLNEARVLLASSAQCELAALNQRVAEEAQRAAAPDIAAAYWARAASLWEAHNDPRQRNAQLRLADCEFLSGRGQQAEARLQGLLAGSQSRHEQVTIHRIRAKCFDAMGSAKQSAEAAVAALRLLGLRLPAVPHTRNILWAFVRMRAALGTRSVESLADAPLITDPQLLTLLDVLNEVMISVYFGMPMLYPILLLTTARICIQHGLSSHSPFIYANVAAAHAMLGDYATAKRYTALTHRCMERQAQAHGSTPAFTGLALTGTLDYAGMPLRDCTHVYVAAAMAGLGAGDIGIATNSMSLAFNMWLLSDRSALADELEGNAGINEQLHRDFGVYRRYYVQAERCLRGVTAAPGSLSDEGFDEADEKRRIDAGELGSSCRSNFYKLRIFVAVMHGDWPRALDSAFTVFSTGALASSSEHSFFIFDVLFAVALAEQAHSTGGFPRKNRRQLRRIVRRMRKIAAVEPFLGLPVSQFVEALQRSLQKEAGLAAALFESAARGLEPTGYTAFAALVSECAGRHLGRNGQQTAAQKHLHAAVGHYATCGALAQQRKLQRELGLLENTAAQVSA